MCIYITYICVYIYFFLEVKEKRWKINRYTSVTELIACSRKGAFYLVGNDKLFENFVQESIFIRWVFKNDHLPQCEKWLRERWAKKRNQEDGCSYGSLSWKVSEDGVLPLRWSFNFTIESRVTEWHVIFW